MIKVKFYVFYFNFQICFFFGITVDDCPVYRCARGRDEDPRKLYLHWREQNNAAAGSHPAPSMTMSLGRRSSAPSSHRPKMGEPRKVKNEASKPWPRATVFQPESTVLGRWISVSAC